MNVDERAFQSLSKAFVSSDFFFFFFNVYTDLPVVLFVVFLFLFLTNPPQVFSRETQVALLKN